MSIQFRNNEDNKKESEIIYERILNLDEDMKYDYEKVAQLPTKRALLIQLARW